MVSPEIVRPDEIRRKNVLTMVHELRIRPRNRSQLAADIGVTKSTVGALVSDLEKRGLIRIEEPNPDGQVGRPGMVVKLASRRVVGVGVEINVGYIALGFVDLEHSHFDVRRQPLDTTYTPIETVMSTLALFIARAIEDFRAENPEGLISGITVGLPGIIDSSAGKVIRSPNIGWVDVPLAELLSDKLPYQDVAIRVQNDANLSAFAEYRHGHGNKTARELLYVTGEAGIGGGIITEGSLVRGANGYAGQFGHMPLDPTATARCECGRYGCWETQCSVAALARAAADRSDVIHDPSLDLEERLTVIKQRVNSGDPRTIKALESVVSSLARGCAVLINALNPAVLVIGGYFAVLKEEIATQLREQILEQVFVTRIDASPEIYVSDLGFAATAIGGGYSALEPVLADPYSVPFIDAESDGVMAASHGVKFIGR